MELINEWKQREIAELVIYIKDLKETLKEIPYKEHYEFCKNNMISKEFYQIAKYEKEENKTIINYKDIKDTGRLELNSDGNYEMVYNGAIWESTYPLKEKCTKIIENHYKALQQKVEKKIGKILEIKGQGYNYIFNGENGSCEIEIIIAGGYNIQRKHTRWIIK